MSRTSGLVIWRHPKPEGAAGRCIGRTDLAVDARRAKRLAHRIRRAARRSPGGAREIWTSPLQRCADVGRWLRRWGWVHHMDARLLEMDFGSWDGQAWGSIPHEAFVPWESDFLNHPPGQGESVLALRRRVESFLQERCQGRSACLWVVGHAGWINALKTLDIDPPRMADWPAPVPYGAHTEFQDVARQPGGEAA